MITFDKEKTKANALKLWKEILIIILLIISFITYGRLNETKKDLAIEKEKRNFELIAGKINSGLEAIQKREAEMYPKLNDEIKQLNKNVKSVHNKVSTLQKNKPTKEQSYENFKNKSNTEISEFFAANGFSNFTSTSGK